MYKIPQHKLQINVGFLSQIFPPFYYLHKVETHGQKSHSKHNINRRTEHLQFRLMQKGKILFGWVLFRNNKNTINSIKYPNADYSFINQLWNGNIPNKQPVLLSTTFGWFKSPKPRRGKEDRNYTQLSISCFSRDFLLSEKKL